MSRRQQQAQLQIACGLLGAGASILRVLDCGRRTAVDGDGLRVVVDDGDGRLDTGHDFLR